MSDDQSGVTDAVDVTLNDEVPGQVAHGPTGRDADGNYVYPEGVKGPADHDTFAVHPNLREEATAEQEDTDDANG